MTDPHPALDTYFAFFHEVGLLEQLSRALVEAHLPPGFLISQFAVLSHLIRVQDGRTPLDLARAFHVPKTTMTHTLSVLEKHALVRLSPNPGDGRSKCVWITDTGRSFCAAAVAGMEPEMTALARRFPAELVGAVVPLLLELRRLMGSLRTA